MPFKGIELEGLDMIDAILRQIEETDDDGVQALTGISSYSLHCFARETGFSPGEYRLLRRLSESAQLLAKTDVPILDIALSAGYESQQAFSDAFTRRYALSPGRFRRNRCFYPLLPPLDAEKLRIAHALLSALNREDVFMNKQGSQTAVMSAFARAWHSLNEKTPIFCDRAARSLFSDEEFARLERLLMDGRAFFVPDAPDMSEYDEAQLLRRIINESIAPTPVCRAAFCERALSSAVKTGCMQYVILGAGLDTFAFRHSEFLRRGHVFEVDHPATQSDKRRRIARAGWTLPENLRLIPTDLSKDSLRDCLLNAGFDPSRKSFFAWLGVSYYLNAEQIDALFGELSSLCAEGSAVAFDYAYQGFFEARERRVQNQLSLAAAAKEPMKSCFSAAKLSSLLQRHSFLLFEEMSPESIQSSLIGTRCPDMKAFEHVHYALCVYKPL